MLPKGDRIVIVKPDGTLLVHQGKKREPVNWNPPGCKAATKLGQEGLQLISKRNKPEEKLLVLFKKLKLVAAFELVDEEELHLIGTESDLVKAVLDNPSLIEENFKPIESEKPIQYGVIDLYGVDEKGNGTAIEFKRATATLSAVGQLKRYTNELEKELNKNVRGILAAPSITSGTLKLLKKEGLEYLKMEEPPTHTIEEVGFDKNQKKIDSFKKTN